MSLSDRVFEALNNALENGYDELKSMSPVEVVGDLMEYDTDLEDEEVGSLLLLIREWQARQ